MPLSPGENQSSLHLSPLLLLSSQQLCEIVRLRVCDWSHSKLPQHCGDLSLGLPDPNLTLSQLHRTGSLPVAQYSYLGKKIKGCGHHFMKKCSHGFNNETKWFEVFWLLSDVLCMLVLLLSTFTND